MFYNLHRSTKSGREEMEKARLTGAGQSLINPKERLLNFQKRQKLKNLLITKFMQKYGINQPDQVLETEITKFLQSEKLTDVDLQRLDAKLKKIYQSRKSKQLLKSTLTHTLLDRNTNLNKSQPDLFPRIQEQKNPNLTSTLNQSLNNQNIEYKKVDNNEIKSKKLRPSASMEMPIRNTKTKYKNPEEELAELEAEFAEEEKEMLKKKNYTRIDFSGMGDEWMAMAQYNKKLYEKQIKEEKEKDAEIKRRTKEDLDNQIKEKLKREYEEVLKEREGEKIYQEHLKHIDELEKEKQEALKRQILREKKNRDAQIKDEYTRKRIDFLKQRKFERNLIKNIQEEMEKEKQAAIQKKKKENEALKKVIRENEIYKEKQKELIQKEKEEDIQSYKEMERSELKKDLERKRYFDNIRRFANKYDENETAKILNQMKQDQKNEDEKVYQLMMEKNRLDFEKEKNEKLKRKQDKIAIKKFLDMQIEEKKKELDLEKAINDEQARIWKMDCQKYTEDEKRINKIIKEMNRRNLDSIMEQMKKRKEKKGQAMSNTEYAMNRETLEKVKEEMDKEKLNN
jgi:hypothetical protein